MTFFILTIIFLTIAWWCGKQFDRAKYFSEKDPLTDTYNRRTIEQNFLKMVLTCKKENKKLGIVMVDLDNFKDINDTYGHHIGDQALIHIANKITESAGKNDLVARWGGDEFVILMSNINANYIQDFKKKVEKGDFDGLLSLKASIGYSTYPDDGESFQELVRQADYLMYKEKVERKPSILKEVE